MKSYCCLSLLLLTACGSSTNDAALLNIDDSLLEDHIQEQLSHNAPHHKDGLPILLVHGMAGFAPVGKFDYFYHVPKAAREAGYDVFVAHTDPFQATAYRAQQLSVQVDKVLRDTGAPRLNIIAHSQGGLDARYLVSSLGYGDRIATLVTIGTPHHGVRMVDIALRFAPNRFMQPLSAFMDALANTFLGGHADLLAQLHDLGANYVRETFNPENEDDPRVEYYSYAGFTQTHKHAVPNGDVVTPLLLASYKLTSMCEGDNDGIVSDESARWGTFLGELPADHWDEIGQLPTADHTAFSHMGFYIKLIDSLTVAGTPPIY